MPLAGSTGARKPLGGSVNHSRSGSGPRGAFDFPIPTQFSGLRLPSGDEVCPQLLSHFTVCPSGSTERIVTGSPVGNPCVVAQARIAHPGDRFLSLFLLRLSAHDLLIYGPSGICSGGGAGRRQLRIRRQDELAMFAILDREAAFRRQIRIQPRTKNRTENRSNSFPQRRIAIVAGPTGRTDQTGGSQTPARLRLTANQSPSSAPLFLASVATTVQRWRVSPPIPAIR